MLALQLARPCAAALAAAALLAGGPAAAQTAPPYPELLRRAEAAISPRLAVAEAEVRAAQGRALQADVRPNPTIGLEIENFAGSAPFDALRGSETTLSTSQTLEIFGQRGARTSAAQAEVGAARARAASARISLAHDLASAYAEAEARQQRLAAAEEALTIAQADARVTRTLVDAGREPAIRAVQANAAVSAAEAELEGVRAHLAEALSRLAALSGSPEAITAVTPGLLNQVAAPSGGAFDGAQTPAVLQARAEREAAARRVRVEQLRGRPDPTVSLGVRRLQMEEATALVAGVSAPLPLFDRNRGATQAARAELQAADARLRQAELEAETEARSATARLSASERRLTAALTGEAAAAEALRAARIGYEAGRFPLTDVLNARRGLTEAREQTIASRLARAQAQAALARLQGRIPFGADQ